jgi:hypothetical protein
MNCKKEGLYVKQFVTMDAAGEAERTCGICGGVAGYKPKSPPQPKTSSSRKISSGLTPRTRPLSGSGPCETSG